MNPSRPLAYPDPVADSAAGFLLAEHCMTTSRHRFSVTVYDDSGATVLAETAFTESQRRGILHMVANAGVEAVWPSAEKGLDYDQFEPNTPNQDVLVIDDPLVVVSRLHPDDSQGHNLGSVGHAKQLVAQHGLCQDQGCPHAAVPHVCVDVGDRKTRTTIIPVAALSPKDHQRTVIETPKLVVQPAAPVTEKAARREIARASGYTGDLCQTCGSDRMKRNGSCLVCESCGGTTGCS